MIPELQDSQNGDLLRELMLRRRNRRDRGVDGKFLQDPQSLARRVRAHLERYQTGKIDVLAKEFGCSEIDIRRAVFTLRHADGLAGIRTLQTADDSGIYYLDDPDPRGLVIRDAAGLHKMGVDPIKAMANKAANRVDVMAELDVVQNSSLLSEVLLHLAEGPHTSRDLSKKVARENPNYAELLRASVRRKLTLFGLELKKEPVGKIYGVGRLTAIHLQATEVPWKVSKETYEMERRVQDIFRENWGKFIGFVCKKTGNVQTSEDIVQTVLTRLLGMARINPTDLAPRLNFAYLYTCLKNAASNDKRNRKNKETSFEDGITRSELAHSGPSAEAQAEAAEMNVLLREALNHPSLETHKTVLELFYFYEMSAEEIADRLDIACDTVYSRLHRGRLKLREILSEKLD